MKLVEATPEETTAPTTDWERLREVSCELTRFEEAVKERGRTTKGYEAMRHGEVAALADEITRLLVRMAIVAGVSLHDEAASEAVDKDWHEYE